MFESFRDLARAPRAVRELPDARTDLVERVVLAALGVEQDERGVPLVREDALSSARVAVELHRAKTLEAEPCQVTKEAEPAKAWLAIWPLLEFHNPTTLPRIEPMLANGLNRCNRPRKIET